MIPVAIVVPMNPKVPGSRTRAVDRKCPGTRTFRDVRPYRIEPAMRRLKTSVDRYGVDVAEQIADLVSHHPLLSGLPGDAVDLVAGCAKNVV